MRACRWAERPGIFGADRPATWGGSTHAGRIDRRRIDHGADRHFNVKMHKIYSGRGSIQDSTGGVYSASPSLQAGLRGPTSKVRDWRGRGKRDEGTRFIDGEEE